MLIIGESINGTIQKVDPYCLEYLKAFREKKILV